jgi:hypothetical protein
MPKNFISIKRESQELPLIPIQCGKGKGNQICLKIRYLHWAFLIFSLPSHCCFQGRKVWMKSSMNLHKDGPSTLSNWSNIYGSTTSKSSIICEHAWQRFSPCTKIGKLNIGINRQRKMFPKIKAKSTEKTIPKRDLMEGLLDFVLFFFNSAVHWKS